LVHAEAGPELVLGLDLAASRLKELHAEAGEADEARRVDLERLLERADSVDPLSGHHS
jgi:hypothetical protein